MVPEVHSALRTIYTSKPIQPFPFHIFSSYSMENCFHTSNTQTSTPNTTFPFQAHFYNIYTLRILERYVVTNHLYPLFNLPNNNLPPTIYFQDQFSYRP